MREKYIKFFKKELVFLLILLIVVCFSFGVTYSNFVYNSDSYRAVEMFAGKLEYELSKSSFTIKPGNNLIKFNIKSLNKVDSYFKIVCDKKVSIKYYNVNSNVIKSKETLSISLIVFNGTNKDATITFKAVGGFITNTYDDIKTNMYEVSEHISVGDAITFNSHIYRLLGVNEDGSYELLSDAVNNVHVSGSHGYNQYINLVNEEIDEIEGANYLRSVSIEDIQKYTKNKLVEYTTPSTYNDVSYPNLWALEEGSIINNESVLGMYSKSGGVCDGATTHAESITLKNIKIYDPEFISDEYKKIFTNSNYLVSTRYQRTSTANVEWGILSIEDGKIKKNKLYDSNNYEVNGSVRYIVNISNTMNLFNQEI